MPAPYDYMSQIQRPDLAKSITSGLMLGQAYGEAVQAQQLREKEAAFKKDFAALFQNPTWETTTALITKYPEYVDKIQAAKKMYGEEKIKGEFDYATKVFRAAQYGNIDIAKKLTQEQIDAARNRGEDVSEYETILKGFDTNPKATAALIGSLAAGLDPEKWKAFADADLARAKIEAETRKVAAEGDKAAIDAKYAAALNASQLQRNSAEVANISSLINERATRLKIEKERLINETLKAQKELGDIPQEVRKDADGAIAKAQSAAMSANQMESLADRIASANIGAQGMFATANDWFVDAFGGQDEASDIRREFTRLRNTEIVKSLPQGPATDRDIAIFSEGYIKASADPKRLEAYLRGAAKIQRIESQVESAKADWLANNRSMQRAKKGFTAGNFEVKPGESFLDFQKRVAEAENKKYSEESRQKFLFPQTQRGQPTAPASGPMLLSETGIMNRPSQFAAFEQPRQAPAAQAPASTPARGGGFTIVGTRPVR